MTTTFVPTPRFWGFVALGVPIALGGVAVPGFERLLLAYNLALFVLLFAVVRIGRRWDVFRVERRTDPILSVRVPNLVRLRVANDGPLPMRLRVRDEPPDGCKCTTHEWEIEIPAERDRELTYSVTPFERGDDEFRGTCLRYASPLGLAWIDRRLPTVARARVYPNVQALKEFDLLKQRGHLSLMGVRKSRIKGLGTEFESLRDYNDDDSRMVDWKSTARRGKLVVKNFEQERNQAVIVGLDIGRHMLSEVNGVRKLDYALDAALMLMHTAERMGDQIGLLMFNDAIQSYIAPRRGKAQVAAILDAVHDAQAEPVQPNYQAAFSFLSSRWKRRSLVVVFTDAENEDQANDLVSALGRIAKRHLLMVVRVADPRLRELAVAPLDQEDALFTRAAAVWYTGDRHRAESRLVAAGIQSVESEPDQLSATLVTAYLRVKERALI